MYIEQVIATISSLLICKITVASKEDDQDGEKPARISDVESFVFKALEKKIKIMVCNIRSGDLANAALFGVVFSEFLFKKNHIGWTGNKRSRFS